MVMFIFSASCSVREMPFLGTFPGFLLELGSYSSKLTESIFFYHKHFLNWGLSCWLGLLLLCLCFPLYWGLDSMEHFICFAVNQHNILPFTFLTFPGIPPLSVSVRLCHSVWALIQGSLRPSGFAKWHVKFSNLLSCFPTCLPALKLAEEWTMYILL